MSLPFQFKEFTIAQDRCAMKIGTDGVLLGAWTSIENNPNSILDLGTGTGIIALQLAQRSYCDQIDAVEIDTDAYEQCTDNFENSPWADRLFCYHASAQEFAMEIEESYDLIVSNPPFYSEDYKTDDKARDTARFTDALPFEHLIGCVHQLLSEAGTFALILPKKEEENFISMAAEAGLFPKRICRVKGTPTSEEKRSMITFTFQKTSPKLESLTLEISRHEYTEDYKNLVKDFYLKM
ncbi:tRNA1(Val) (adenine(37)-N6)-methyltransferase [Ulvibacter litoralis]|uniref:tRNA1(Val) (adenine(37)-N6)-methyltransferase n=1 Tax=Ulvibacter litoralis TaxID=227084 RepID=A0A1G7CS40_9FLAO|nr:methyltransferase [Ulvibacter litoralis]GHC46484.1 tRNA1(Val) (adenine(37)-N6)-methyltransferase [Ulvibacter litoralis]SDE41580.1 tRNA1Val (adenine37-N6)-methyltransferase [Ulvibacter litoralis]